MVLKTSFTTVCLILGSIVAQSNQYQPADTYKTQPVPEVDLTKSVSEFALDIYDVIFNQEFDFEIRKLAILLILFFILAMCQFETGQCDYFTIFSGQFFSTSIASQQWKYF